MFEGYKTDVQSAYEKKKAEGSLSSNLLSPTRARIKEECLMVYTARPSSPKDDEILRIFLDEREKGGNYSQIISLCDADKFRPLDNFLKERIDEPSPKNIDLLAWLIDYPIRPYSSWLAHKREEVAGKGKDELKLKTAEEVKFRKKPINPRIWTITMWLFLIAIALAGPYLIWEGSEGKEAVYPVTGKEKCMYWAGDHFQPVSCDKTIGGVNIIPLDEQRLRNLKKINRADTLTKYDLGKVWYAKEDGYPEFYTFGGDHPTDTTRRLLPLTQYMLNKYVNAKNATFNSRLRIILTGLGCTMLAVLLTVWYQKRSMSSKRKNNFSGTGATL